MREEYLQKKEHNFRNEDTDDEESELSDEGYNDGGCDDAYDLSVYDEFNNDDDDDDELDEFEDLVLYNEMEEYIQYYQQFVEPMHQKYGSRLNPHHVLLYGIPHISYFDENLGLVFSNPFLGTTVWG